FWQAKNSEKAEQQYNPLPSSLVSLLESEGAEVYSVWVPVFVDLAALQSEASSWRKPSLTVIRGTPLGEAGFHSYYPHPMFVKNGDSMVEIYVD
ncbi:hypothetical protein KPB01_39050, partial [Burkholderia sola]|nr:hypothetical protein [Burkholderia sola]